MDSFEARVQFSKQLSSLTPSRQAALDCAKFILRNKDNQDDLFSVILETLNSVDLNCRVNVFQFVEELVSLALVDPEGNDTILKLILKELKTILYTILPQKSGEISDEIRLLTNLSPAFNILVSISKLLNFKNIDYFINLFNSNLLSERDIEFVQLNLSFDDGRLYKSDNPDSLKPPPYSSDPSTTMLNNAWYFLVSKRRQSQYERQLIDFHHTRSPQVASPRRPTRSSPHSVHNNKYIEYDPHPPPVIQLSDELEQQQHNHDKQPMGASTNSLNMTHKQMLQRIEADRERQKRGKENLWKVQRLGNGDLGSKSEFLSLCESFKEFDPVADRPLIDELNDLYDSCVFRPKVEATTNGKSHALTGSDGGKSVTTNDGRNIGNLKPKKPVENEVFKPKLGFLGAGEKIRDNRKSRRM
ncbi:hypothetical protein CANARDRAFT_27553 [[Candida] arabinofermentans NRRL YB-2248]|uniref:CID domain-containing protein n=1 Tax=[Candida] arabinofermentans NRRL YB-2248 TaxID=983967 RepID=A0A1E4T3I8_9ASCO|nr:hypothetical protein CANARDRAFT_27553 [[Candida] arabinofermentans NRRL YB-2248]